jgi:hypothetical protein
MRISLGVQEWVWWLMTFGSAALTFTVRGPRMLWPVLLAAICGFCEARIIFYDDMPAESPARTVDWLLFLAPIILGAGYAWRQPGWSGFKAAWLGLPYGVAFTILGLAGSEYALQALIIISVVGTILATGGAVFAVALRVLARRLGDDYL